MKITLDDKQLEILIQIVAERHMIEYMKGKDNDYIEDILQSLYESYKEAGKGELFMRIFQEVKA
jgi:hypothetical protein